MTTWPEFESLQILKGRPYLELRDRILQSAEFGSRVSAVDAAGDWKARIHARILLGWTESRPLYQGVLADLNAVDIAREGKKAGGVPSVWATFASKARNEYKEPVLPLCWEALMKYRNLVPDWQMLAFLRMTGVLPNIESIEPVIAFMYDSTGPGNVDMAARTLELLPAAAVKASLERHIAEFPKDGNPMLKTTFSHTLIRINANEQKR